MPPKHNRRVRRVLQFSVVSAAPQTACSSYSTKEMEEKFIVILRYAISLATIKRNHELLNLIYSIAEAAGHTVSWH